MALVHNHGAEEGAGLACSERIVEGELIGACIAGLECPHPWRTFNSYQCGRCGVVLDVPEHG